MTAVACLEAAVLVAVVWLLQRHHAQQAAAWAVERRELLTRIQHPTIVPSTVPAGYHVPEPEEDDIHLIGTILPPPEEFG